VVDQMAMSAGTSNQSRPFTRKKRNPQKPSRLIQVNIFIPTAFEKKSQHCLALEGFDVRTSLRPIATKLQKRSELGSSLISIPRVTLVCSESPCWGTRETPQSSSCQNYQ